jgi:aminobenzoyl-glutamate utilization protein B
MALLASPALGEPLSESERGAVLAGVDDNYDTNANIARKLWEWAEVGYQENRSTKLLQDTLARRHSHSFCC